LQGFSGTDKTCTDAAQNRGGALVFAKRNEKSGGVAFGRRAEVLDVEPVHRIEAIRIVLGALLLHPRPHHSSSQWVSARHHASSPECRISPAI
jgi:hypothetical protein